MKTIKSIFAMFLVAALLLNGCAVPSVAAESVVVKTTTDKDAALTEPFDLSEPEALDSGAFPYDEGTVLVKFAIGFDGEISAELQGLGVERLEYMFQTDEGDWYTAFLKRDAHPEAVVGALREMDSVSVAEFNYIYSVESIIDTDTLHYEINEKNNYAQDQWYLRSCGLQDASRRERRPRHSSTQERRLAHRRTMLLLRLSETFR